MTSQGSQARVLVVEDHEPTARLITTVLEEAGDAIATDVVSDGAQCLTVLHGTDGSSPTPDLVLLDLDLPEVDGHTVLERRREQRELTRIPTVVLSSTDDVETIQECYEQGANAFIPKPGELDGYEDVADSIVDFWFCTAAMPRSAAEG